MSGSSLEDRLATLEAEVAELKHRLNDQEPKKSGWKAIEGTLLNDPYYEEAMNTRKRGSRIPASVKEETDEKMRAA